jgi:hypothetical protein
MDCGSVQNMALHATTLESLLPNAARLAEHPGDSLWADVSRRPHWLFQQRSRPFLSGRGSGDTITAPEVEGQRSRSRR